MKNKKINTIKNNIFMLKTVWGISPKIIIYAFAISIFDFAAWVFNTVIFTKYLFGAEEINRTFEETAIFVMSFFGVLLIIGLFGAWYQHRWLPKAEQMLHYNVNKMLFAKAGNVDVACYENPEFYDNYTKATTEACTRAMSVTNNVATMFSAFLASLYVIVTMFTINVWAGFFAFLPFLGNLVFGKFINNLYYKKNLDDIPFKRRQEYVNRAMYLQKFSKEIRLSNTFKILKDTYNKGTDGIIRNVNKYRTRIFWLEYIRNELCFPVAFEGMWLFAAYCAMVTKSILIGDFLVLARSIVSTTWMMREFTEALNACYQNGLYIDNLKKFLSYEEKIPEDQDGDNVPKTVETLQLHNVSFCYEGSDKKVLDGINMVVHAGEKISLVGHNGAGKTTLIKLIMRLYDPTSGEILLNGIDIKTFNLHQYRELIGTTFQDYQMFSMTVAENVLMKKVTDDNQRQEAIAALNLSGAYDKVMSLPHGIDTILTREFDDEGAVLSGGQFQKIAVARAFARKCPIVLLDEPSSALDPIAEYQMYETIMQIANGDVHGNKRLSIIISHRLSSATMADRVYMLENGKVIENGTHKELMKIAGVYADMFTKQAENYLQEVEQL